MTLSSALLSSAVANIFLSTALLTPPSILNHSQLASVFLPLIWSCNIYSWKNGLGMLAAPQALWSANLLLFRCPRESFKLLHRHADDNKVTYNQEAYPEAFAKRFWWVTKLCLSLQYVGWKLGDDVKPGAISHPAAAGSRALWLLKSCLSAALCVLIIDVANSYMLHDPYFQSGTNIDCPWPEYLVSYLGRTRVSFIPPRLPRIIIFGLQQYTIFSLIGSMIAIICVSLGGIGLVDDFWGGTHNWPPFMGNPGVVLERGLRGFWGSFWHQLFRHIFADPGKAAARAILPGKKSILYYAVQIAVAFFLSGAMHAASLPRSVEYASMLRYAGFFWIHGLCVLFEVLVSYATLPSNPAAVAPLPLKNRWIVRLVWTVGVLYTTTPMIVSELVKISAQIGSRPVLFFPVPHK